MSSLAPVASASTCALLLLLTACGGSGGGGGGGGPPPPGPVIGQASGDTPFAANCSPVGPAAAVYANAEVEPQVAVSPANPARVLGAWQQDRHSDGGARGLVIGVSSDGGQTWARQALRASACAGGVYERATDPWVAFGADGRAYAIALALDSVASVDNAILVFRSLDGGTTWGPATALIEDGAAGFNDKEAMAADPASVNFAYAAWDRLTQDNRGPAWFARTIDGGETWEAARPIHDPGTGNQTINATPAVAPDGTVYVFFTEIVRSGAATVSTQRLMRSTDHGATFAAPVTIGQVLAAGARDPNTGNAIRDGSGLGSIAIGPAGEVVVAWQDTRATGAGRDGVLLQRSTDRGDTWSAPVVVNRNTSVVAFTPTVAVRSDGRIGVTYFDMRDERAGDTRLDIGYWIVTSADGSSWSETRVAGPFDLSVAPMARGLFLGDYMGLATSGSSFVPFFARTNDNSPSNRTDIHAVPVGRLTAGFEPTGAQALAKPAHLATPTAAEQRRSYDAIMRTLERRIPDWPRRQAAFEAAAARR